MDVSPKWWIKVRTNEKFLKQYVYEKFERDYYPRIILQGGEKFIAWSLSELFYNNIITITLIRIIPIITPAIILIFSG